MDFIKLTGALLAVAGDEGNRGAFFEENGGGGDLTGLQGKLLHDLDEMFFDHELGKVEAAWIRRPKQTDLQARGREVSLPRQE